MNRRLAIERGIPKKLAVATWVLAALLPALAVATPPHGRTHVKNVTFVAFDVETTGLSPYQERVIEIGAVKFRNGRIIEEKEWLIRPDKPIHWAAERTHRITMDMLKDSPEFREIYGEFMGFIDGAVLMAHNARFDVDFIREEILRNGLDLPDVPVVDSLRLFRKWFPTAPSHALEPLSEYLGVRGDLYHRALADSVYILDIMNIGLGVHGGDRTLKSLYDDAGGTLYFAPTRLAMPALP